MSELLLDWRVNADLQPCLVFSFELDDTVNEREQGIIRALLNIAARMELGTSLSDKDIACLDKLSSEPFDAETLRLAVAPVS
jgi:hypothetical protein